MSINPTQLTPKTKNKLSSLVVMMSVAIMLGLVAAVGIWQYLNQTQEKVKKLTVTRAVVVASMAIPAGIKISEKDIAIKQFPAQSIPKDYPSSIEVIMGRIAKSTIQPDEIITESRLVVSGAAGGLPLVIPPGQRAVTIKVNEVIGVGGFINPGDRIDILSVVKKRDEQSFSKTILQNVLVLTVGDKILDPNNLADPLPKIVSQVTVALNPRDVEKLSLASETGQLQLVLRPHGESTIAITEGITLEDVYGELAVTQPTIKEQNALPPQAISISTKADKHAIEIILGDRRSYFYY